MRPRLHRRLAVVCLTALLLILVWLGVRAVQTLVVARALRADLRAAEALLADGPDSLDLREATALLGTTRSHLLALERRSRPFLWLAAHLGWLPGYGPDIQAASTLVDIVLLLTDAVDSLLGPLGPLIEQVGTGGTGDTVLAQEVASAFLAAQPQLRQAELAVRQAASSRATLDADRLGPPLQGLLLRLDRYLPMVQEGIAGGLLVPELLGAEGPRTYLILVQNEDELRATGGFISGVAEATVDDGQLRALQYEDSYAIDDFSQPYPGPPGPLQEYMLAELWVLRDSNWSPDFPTSAEKAIELYRISRRVEIDGVVALDQEAIRLFVGAIGPLQVETAPEPVEGGNVIRLARQAWSPLKTADRASWRHRKDFMGVVVDAAVRRAEAGVDRQRLLELARAARQALHQKHLLIYLREPDAAGTLAEAGWDGGLRQAEGDYLMVVDTNVGFNKVNGLVTQSLQMRVDLTDVRQPRTTLLVRHVHPLTGWQGACDQTPRYDGTYQQMMERCYWDYLRVLLPPSAALSGAESHAVPGDALLRGRPSPAEVSVQDAEKGHPVLGTLLLLRPGETLATRFDIALPPAVIQRERGTCRYSLTVQKQPGTQRHELLVQVLLPSGTSITRSHPAPDVVNDAGLVYTRTLETDQSFELSFACPD
jgi:hypothetical protein